MIEYRNRSVLDFGLETVIAHGVNCQGKMGSGVAKSIKEKFPTAFADYKKLCDNKFEPIPRDNNIWHSFLPKDRQDPLLGIAQLVKIDGYITVANLFTQQYYGSDGQKYADQKSIYAALMNLGQAIASRSDIPDRVALPKIGCGLGGLDWDTEVEPILREVYKSFPLNYIVCSI